VTNSPKRIRPAWRADYIARFKTQWLLVEWRSPLSPITRWAAVTVRAPGASSVPTSKSWAWGQTRCENSGAKDAKTSMMASGRGGMRCPPPIA
jgi:hypothetical protein